MLDLFEEYLPEIVGGIGAAIFLALLLWGGGL